MLISDNSRVRKSYFLNIRVKLVRLISITNFFPGKKGNLFRTMKRAVVNNDGTQDLVLIRRESNENQNA